MPKFCMTCSKCASVNVLTWRKPVCCNCIIDFHSEVMTPAFRGKNGDFIPSSNFTIDMVKKIDTFLSNSNME